VVEALQNPAKFNRVRETARQSVIEHFDAERVCLPPLRRLLEPQRATSAEPDLPVRSKRVADQFPAPAETDAKAGSAKDLLSNPFNLK
jgi:hypothetical protein